jgi:hypothetical protein
MVVVFIVVSRGVVLVASTPAQEETDNGITAFKVIILNCEAQHTVTQQCKSPANCTLRWWV